MLAAADLFDPSFSVGPCPLSHVEAALWLAPLLASVAPFDEVLEDDELPDILWLDESLAEVMSPVFEFVALLLVLPLLADALLLADADFTLLAVSALLDDEASVVALLLFALLEAEDVSTLDALLLALSFSAAFLLAVVA